MFSSEYNKHNRVALQKVIYTKQKEINDSRALIRDLYCTLRNSATTIPDPLIARVKELGIPDTVCERHNGASDDDA